MAPLGMSWPWSQTSRAQQIVDLVVVKVDVVERFGDGGKAVYVRSMSLP